MKQKSTTTAILVILLIVIAALFLNNYKQVKSLTRRLSIEQSKVNFIQSRVKSDLIPFDSVYSPNADTVYFYKKGIYQGKSITVIEP